MFTRIQLADKKRNAVEEIERRMEEKRNKKMFAPRKDGRIGPHDILVDHNIPIIDCQNSKEPVEVKVDIKTEYFVEAEDRMRADGGNEVFQQDVKIEEECGREVKVFLQCEDIDEEGGDEGEEVRRLEVFYQNGKIEMEGGDEEEKDGRGDEEEKDGVAEAFQQNEKIEMEGGDEEEKDGGAEAFQLNEKNEIKGGNEDERNGRAEASQLNEKVIKVLCIILPFLEQTDIFRFRLVNKQCRGFVDDFIEKTVVSRPYDDKAFLEKVENCPSRLCPIPTFWVEQYATYYFTAEKQLEKFNQSMQGHANLKLSPFVGGARVTLKNLFVRSSALSPATKWFLENFGLHIRRLKIKQGGYGWGFVNRGPWRGCFFDIVGFVKCVKECLHYVPNLEELGIAGQCLTEADKNKMTEAQVELYRNEIVNRTPKLKKLVSLKINHLYANYGIQKFVPYLEEIFCDIMIMPDYKSQLKNYRWILHPNGKPGVS